LKRVIDTTASHRDAARPVTLGVCGEMGGRRLEALALLGLGIRRLSITPAAIGPIKELVCNTDLGEIATAMAGWLAAPPPDLRGELTRWAEQRGIEVE
jgi:phosphotransferase system enzyme I (PtsP)